MFTVAEIMNWPHTEPQDSLVSTNDLAHTVALYGPFPSQEATVEFIRKQRGLGVTNHFASFRLRSPNI